MAQLYSSLLIVVTLAVLCESAALNAKQDSKCAANSIYLKCGNNCRPAHCNQTIDELKNCSSACLPGCYCMPGFIRLTPKDDACVPEKLCRHKPIPKCGINEIYLDKCQWDCAKSCENLNDSKCDRWCVRGCVCQPGYVRAHSSHSSACVLSSLCAQQLHV